MLSAQFDVKDRGIRVCLWMIIERKCHRARTDAIISCRRCWCCCCHRPGPKPESWTCNERQSAANAAFVINIVPKSIRSKNIRIIGRKCIISPIRNSSAGGDDDDAVDINKSHTVTIYAINTVWIELKQQTTNYKRISLKWCLVKEDELDNLPLQKYLLLQLLIN